VGADGNLIYSSDPEDFEEDRLHGPHLPKALSGKATGNIDYADGSGPDSPRGNDLFEVFPPVIFPGTTEVVGALEVYQYYAPTAQRIDEMRAWVFLITGLGFVVLYGVLVTVVWGASRTISRQRSALVDANLELESRVEARTVEITQLYQEREAAAAEKAVVAEVARIVTSTLDIGQVYEKFAAAVKKLVDFDRVAITVLDHGTGILTRRHLSGKPMDDGGGPAGVPLNGTIADWVSRTGQSCMREDIGAGDSFNSTHDAACIDVGLRSSLAVPLFSKGRLAGVLVVHSRRSGAYGPREQALLERLAEQVAPAVENAQLYEELAREARERELLAEIGRIISSSLDIDEVFERFAGQV